MLALKVFIILVLLIVGVPALAACHKDGSPTGFIGWALFLLTAGFLLYAIA